MDKDRSFMNDYSQFLFVCKYLKSNLFSWYSYYNFCSFSFFTFYIYCNQFHIFHIV